MPRYSFILSPIYILIDSFRYDQKVDKVKCCVTTTYGPHSWPLPVQEITYPGINITFNNVHDLTSLSLQLE